MQRNMAGFWGDGKDITQLSYLEFSWHKAGVSWEAIQIVVGS